MKLKSSFLEEEKTQYEIGWQNNLCIDSYIVTIHSQWITYFDILYFVPIQSIQILYCNNLFLYICYHYPSV